MAFAENIAELRRRNLHYVVAAGQKERDRLLAEFETVDGFEEVVRQPSPRNPGQKKSSVRVKAHPSDKELLILCISQERVEKDRAIRTKQEGRFLRDAARLQARIDKGRLKKEIKIGEAIGRLKERYPRVARYYSLIFDAKTRQLKNEPNEEKRKVAASLDGSYLLRSDRLELTADEGWRIYGSLTPGRERLSLYEEPSMRASHLPSLGAQGGIAYFSVRPGIPLVGCYRDDIAASRYSHVVGDGSRLAGHSRDRDDCAAHRPERSAANSPERHAGAGPQGSVRGAWGADRDHASSKNLGAEASRIVTEKTTGP